jgi:hypothetical protein
MQATGQAATRRPPLQLLAAWLPTLLLAVLGVALIVIGRGYQVGSLTAMGPGFLPVLLGLVLLVLAALLLLREAALPLLPLPLRPLVCVTAGMLAWALLAERLGFFAAALAQILLTSMALPQQERRLELIVAVLLSIGAYLLFVRVLGLPLPAFGS